MRRYVLRVYVALFVEDIQLSVLPNQETPFSAGRPHADATALVVYT